MPYAHVGLTVSDLPASTSFFLATLNPLGYQFIGERDNSIGFGIYEADFFLSQNKGPTKPAPVHLAFAAPTSIAVRQFYANALDAGGSQAGTPSYRGDKQDVFNAAIVDLDGNTIEAIHHVKTQGVAACIGSPPRNEVVARIRDAAAASETSRSIASRSMDSQSEEDRSVGSSHRTTKSSSTSLFPSTTPRSIRSGREVTSDYASAGSSLLSSSAPQQSSTSSRTLMGTLIGGAAVAAALYTFHNMERDSAQKEREFSDRVHSRARRSESSRRSNTSTYSNRRSQIEPSSSYYHPSDRQQRLLDFTPTQERADYRRPQSSARDLVPLPQSRSSRRTYEGLWDYPPSDVPLSPRRDSAISITSHHSNKSRRSRRDDRRHFSRRELEPIEQSRTRKLLLWPSSRESNVSRRTRRHSASPAPRSRVSESTARPRDGVRGREIGAEDVPLPASVVDSRAELRNREVGIRPMRRRRASSSDRLGWGKGVSLAMIKKAMSTSIDDEDDQDRGGRALVRRDERRRPSRYLIDDGIETETVLPSDSISCADFETLRSRGGRGHGQSASGRDGESGTSHSRRHRRDSDAHAHHRDESRRSGARSTHSRHSRHTHRSTRDRERDREESKREWDVLSDETVRPSKPSIPGRPGNLLPRSIASLPVLSRRRRDDEDDVKERRYDFSMRYEEGGDGRGDEGGEGRRRERRGTREESRLRRRARDDMGSMA